MYILDGHGLTRGEWFMPETQPMTLQERDSTSSIQLGPEAPEIGFDDWILDDDWPEGPYVWRVKNLGDATETETRTVDLEHVIKALDNIDLETDLTASDAQSAVQAILSRQSDWVLGDFEYSVSNPYEFSEGDSLYDALESVTETLEDAVWEYGLSSYPFTLHIRQRQSGAACEMRGSRNLSTMRKSISRSGMYTRIYPIGENNLRITGGYISRNENLYGRIDHHETDQGKTSEASLRAWAEARLRKHSEPNVTITISGLELSAETGESLDRLKLNRICRVPLPKKGVTILEKITRLQWQDRRKEPEKVSVNLCNNSTDITSLFKKESRSSARGARGQAKQNYLFEANGEHLLYEVFDECGHVHGVLRMTEESLRIAFENLNECTRSEFRMTSESLRIKFEDDIASTRSQFEMTAESLRITFENETESLRSDIQVQAGRIGLVVSGSGSSASIKISAIVDGINGSQAEINADRVIIGSGNDKKAVKVYVDGQISATEGIITNLTTGTTKATLINADALVGDSVSATETMYTPSMSIGTGTGGGSGSLYYRGAQYYRQALTLGPSNSYISEGHFLGDSSTGVNLNHYHTITATEGTGADAGKIIITLTDPLPTSDTSGHTTNFNIAATQTYISGVAAAKKSVKVEPFEASSWTQAGLPSNRTFTYKTDASGAASSTWQEDIWYLTGGTSWSGNSTTVYMRYGSNSGTAYAALDVVYPGGGAPTVSLVSAVGTNSTRDGSASDNRIYVDAEANSQSTRQNFRLISTTYTDGGGVSKYCVDLHAGTDSSGRRIGRISVQDRFDTGYSSGYAVGGQTAVLRYYGSTAPSGQTVTTLGRGSYYVVRHKESPSGSEIDGAYFYCPASDYQSGYNAGYAAGKDDLSWSWSSAASTSNSEPSGNFAKTYSWSKGYSWGWFTVTVNGHSYRFKIHITS